MNLTDLQFTESDLIEAVDVSTNTNAHKPLTLPVLLHWCTECANAKLGHQRLQFGIDRDGAIIASFTNWHQQTEKLVSFPQSPL